MLIEATDLTKEFPRARAGGRLFTAVHPLDLTLDEGQLTVITGHSGSGKSTLLNMLAGMLPPTGGTVCLGGIDLYAMREEECARCVTSASVSFRRGTLRCEASPSWRTFSCLPCCMARVGRCVSAPRNSCPPWVCPSLRMRARTSCQAVSCAASVSLVLSS